VKARPDRRSHAPRPSVPDLQTLRKVERLKTVYRLTDAVSRAHGLAEIYEAALRGIERALGTNRASILLLDTTGVMRFRAWHGLSDHYRAAVEGHSPWKGDVKDPEPVLVPDVRRAPELAAYADLFASEKIEALAFIPLVARDRLIGKFMVYFQERYEFRPEEVELARTLAGHVAFAVERKQGDEERKRAEGALQFLAGASASLDRSLDYDATVRAIARLSVPILGDWALVDVFDEGGSLLPAVSAHAEAGRTASLARLVSLRQSGEADAETWRSLALVGSSESSSVADLRFGAPCGEPPLPEILRELGASSALAVPLRARGRVLGLLTLVSADRVYEPRDVSLTEDLARRAATALDNARLYREAQESERRKEEFLAVLAHELRNPLAPLLTCLELMRAHDVRSTSIGRWRTIMERQVRNLTRLVDDLLDVSRVTRGKIELQKRPVQLATVISRAVETARPLIDSRDLLLSIRVDPTLRFEADPLRVEQVLANLLNNAAKATQPRGRIDIEGRRDGEGILIAMRDNGIGIASDMLPRIFDLFVQGGQSLGGLGVGLMLARTLIELHGGTIRASSAGSGLGSEFVIRLPAGLQDGRSEWSAAPAAEPGAAHNRRALVVDDNIDGATVLAEALRTRGHEVHIAHDGQTALEQALRHAPDVVLLDIGLPDLDGYEVASRIRKEPALIQTKVIALTGFGQEQHRGRPEAAEFAYHMVKPIDLAQLDAVLASWEIEHAEPKASAST